MITQAVLLEDENDINITYVATEFDSGYTHLQAQVLDLFRLQPMTSQNTSVDHKKVNKPKGHVWLPW